MIGKSLYSQRDPQQKLVTIMALLDAYNTKKLEWTPGLVTYWQKGRQLCQPRPFDWDEYEAVQRENGDMWSFWVEGVKDFFSLLSSIQVDNTDTVDFSS